MNNRYNEATTAIRRAEKALETLKEFSENQYKEKGETMLEQIVDYVVNTLANVDYMCCGCKYCHISLSALKNRFVFYIYQDCAGYPIFSISTDGEVNYIRELNEQMMITLVDEWIGFKKELDFTINITLKEHTKNINDQLSHIGYMNEKLSKWCI